MNSKVLILKAPLYLILLFIYAQAFSQLSVDNQTTLLLNMNGNVNGAQNETATQSDNINYATGKFGQAASFNSNSDLRFAANNNIQAAQGTIEAWVKSDTDGNDNTQRTIFSWGVGGGMLMSKDGGNYIKLGVNRYGSDPIGNEMGVGINISNWQAGEWHHVACSWSGTSLKFYIDGILVDQTTMNFTPPAITQSDFYIGSDSGNAHWNGEIDDFRISNTQRSDDEILQSAGFDLSVNPNNFVQQSNLVIVLRNHAGGTNNAALSSIRTMADDVTDFYWKHSKHSLLLDWSFHVVNNSTDVFSNVGNGTVNTVLVDQLLRNEGFTENQFDAVVMILPNGGNFAYGVNRVLDSSGFCHFNWFNDYEGDRWVFTHEFNHVVDAMMQSSGVPEYSHNHPGTTRALGEYLPPSGPDFDLNALLMQDITKAKWLRLAQVGVWGTKRSFLDSDGDGFANQDNRLPIDEVRFGSNINNQDSDGDGLTDLEEHYAGIWSSSNPTSSDTDGDGVADGLDTQPLYGFPTNIAFGSTAAGSTNLNNYQFFGAHNGMNIYANNDQSRLSMALDQIPFSGRYEVHFDFNNDGLFYGRDNIVLIINNGNLESVLFRDAVNFSGQQDYVESTLSNNLFTVTSNTSNTRLFISIPASNTYDFAISPDRQIGFRVNQGRNNIFQHDDYLAFGLGSDGPSCAQVSETCESFESDLGMWMQATDDDLDWRIDSNGTPSSSTGPSNATDGSKYLYVESSVSGNGFPNKTAVLETECFKLNGFSSPNLTFNLHMYGSTMGTIEVQVLDTNSGSSQTVFTMGGNQGNTWSAQSVDLSAYLGKDIIISFKAVTGTSYRSDIALDEICLKDINCTVGAPCDDGNECTIDDTYQADCSCVGTAFEPIISNVTFENSPGGCQEIGIMNILYPTNQPFSKFKISVDGGANYWNLSTTTGSVTFDRGPGSYEVYIQTEDGTCTTFMRTINIPRAPDTDNDGICDALDECPNDPINTCNIGCTTFNAENFESGWGFWQDGGTNAVLLTNATYANSGTNSIYIRGNTSTSTIRSYEFRTNSNVELSFHLYPYSMETGDKFHVEVVNENVNWTTVKTYTSGPDFKNNERIDFTLLIDDFDFTPDSRIRFRAETSSTADYVILDDITVSFCGDNVCIDADGDGVCADEDPNDSDPCIPNSCAGVDCTRDSRIDQTCTYDISFDNTFGLWANPTEDDLDWVRRSGNTPSSRTGPSSAAHGSHYIYVESSTNGRGFPNKTAILESPCYKIPSGGDMYLNFRYHMYGSSMGSLDLEMTTDDINWNSIWSATGDQGNQWNNHYIEVTGFRNQTVRFRFKAVTGSSYRSDIALDLIQSRCLVSVLEIQNRDKTDETSLNIFPNPVSHTFQLEWTSSSNESFDIEILNALGQIVYRGNKSKSNALYEERFNVSDYKKGIYFLRLTQQGHIQIKKFIVEKN